MLLPNLEVLQRHKASGFPFENGMVLPTPFYALLFSASAVITVSDFYAPEVRFSCVLTNISGHPLLSSLPLLLYSLHRCLLRSQGVPGTS